MISVRLIFSSSFVVGGAFFYKTNFCALDISLRSYPSLYSLPVHFFFPVTFHILIIHSIGLYIYIFLAILVNVTLYIVGLKCSTLEADMFTYIPLTLNFRFQSEVALQICRLDKSQVHWPYWLLFVQVCIIKVVDLLYIRLTRVLPSSIMEWSVQRVHCFILCFIWL